MSDWYGERMTNDAFYGDPDWDQTARASATRQPAQDQRAAGLWLTAYFDCLFERRAYDIIPATVPMCAACQEVPGIHASGPDYYCDACADFMLSWPVAGQYQDPRPEM
jgi:hypothetical protein